ncbi:MAG: hypothetical protein ACRDMA_15160, partial [Solirubrobacterales bacterium]
MDRCDVAGPVDAGMHPMQAPSTKAVLDLGAGEAGRQQLGPAHHPALHPGELSDHFISGTPGTTLAAARAPRSGSWSHTDHN